MKPITSYTFFSNYFLDIWNRLPTNVINSGIVETFDYASIISLNQISRWQRSFQIDSAHYSYRVSVLQTCRFLVHRVYKVASRRLHTSRTRRLHQANEHHYLLRPVSGCESPCHRIVIYHYLDSRYQGSLLQEITSVRRPTRGSTLKQ